MRPEHVSTTTAVVRAAATLGTAFTLGAHYWLDVNLPGGAPPLVLIVRIAAIEPAIGAELTLRLAVCPEDDGSRVADAIADATGCKSACNAAKDSVEQAAAPVPPTEGMKCSRHST